MHETFNTSPNTLIMRELLPPPISSCDVRSLSIVKQFVALSSVGFAHAGRAFCVYACVLFRSFSSVVRAMKTLLTPSWRAKKPHFTPKFRRIGELSNFFVRLCWAS